MKNIKVRCFFGINGDNHTNESYLEITDDSTGKRICEVRFGPIELVQLLGRMGAVRGKATFMDEENYGLIGKSVINRNIEVPLPNNYSSDWEEFALKTAEELINRENDGYKWYISSYLGSRDNKIYKNGVYHAVVNCRRYE